jgi:hypothetical protein
MSACGALDHQSQAELLSGITDFKFYNRRSIVSINNLIESGNVD